MEAYRAECRQVRERLDRATVYSQVHPQVVVPPDPIQLLCRGVMRGTGLRVWIDVMYVPLGAAHVGGTVSEGKLLKTFSQIDLATVVAVLLSFLAVVLGFDGISGERERGTLQQVLANPIRRGTLVLAKLFGGTLSLCVPLSVAYVLGLLVLEANPDIRFSGQDVPRLLLLFILSCLLLGQIYSFSLMVSSAVRSSATSLVICLFAWLCGSVGYMNLLPSLSRFGVEEHPFQEYRDQESVEWDRFSRKVEEWERQHPPPSEPYLECLDEGGVRRFGHPAGHAWLQRRHPVVIDARMELASRLHQLQMANFAPLAREADLIDAWSILSPFTNYRILAKRVARTTLDDLFYVQDAGQRYRETYIQFLRGRGAFASRRWFTDDPVDSELLIPHPDRVSPEMLVPDAPFMQKRLAWARDRQAEAERDPGRRLDLSDMPVFREPWQRSLTESLILMTPGLAVLLLIFGATVLFTVVWFSRCDVQ